MPNLDAPARLAFWPEFPWDQGRDYGTLRQALTEAAQRPKSARGAARLPRSETVFNERWPQG